MNPWAPLTTQDLTLQPSHVTAYLSRELLRKAEETKKASERKRKTVHVVKERNYVTYNYVVPEAAEDGDDDNTLSSILVRAMHRKTKRKEIDEAMKIRRLEDAKRKVDEEKRQCVEARRRQSDRLKEIRETHRLRVIKEEQWRAKEAKQARLNRLADVFRKNLLLRHYFGGFKKLVEISNDNRARARSHYRLKIMQKAMSRLVIHRDKEQQWREHLATSFHRVCVLHKFFTQWKERTAARAEQMVRAGGHHRRRLLRQYLWLWRWAALDQLLQRRAATQLARQHYHRKVLRRGVRSWRQYLEDRRARRQQDLVASRLRFLVKNIIPDFSPASSDDDDDGGGGSASERDDRWEDLLAVMTV
ncbi:coiled-coil domain-containing protein 191-like [Procambarus clarkii]|uniref:coiled-coil domain-containing protein 191-like n=1 Tax=Procambarus clarkii TaxID=6728 RepID=UPI001E671151|nr:coiled-coil domain-containing protein 191-like [Procambarus clarkii]